MVLKKTLLKSTTSPLIEDGEIEEEDAEDALVELEEGVKATVDELREVNLGNTEDPRQFTRVPH
ncbi:UNVERIFIED_CONTAM: hypothetical protein Slati_3141700 [Sesamum latifolium]|uniref:Uncharacterized protein n=1 Tax=Sesamum latifolium TaxID=2727402 RepID=A0AAW2UX16_9LAMI